MVRRLSGLIFALACASTCHAGIVTFESTPLGEFSSGSEDGFTFTGSTTRVFSGTMPGRYIIVHTANSLATLTFSNGGTFTFSSVDIGRAATFNITSQVVVTGYLGGSQVGQDLFNSPSASIMVTNFAGNLAGLVLDQLTIQFRSSPSSSQAIDNVTFGEASAVPEPATLAMSGVGILVAAAVGRKRRAATA